MSTLSSVTSAPTGGAAIVTAGGAGGAPPVTITALHNADVLIIALGDRCGGCAPAATPQRPSRPEAGPGWYVVATANREIPKSAFPATGTKATPPKTTTSCGSTASTTSSKTSSTSTSKSTGPLAFLDDPKMSVEEKLFKFLCYVSDKSDKELEAKMKEISGSQKSSSGSSGLLGGLTGGVGALLGGGSGGGVASLLGPIMQATGLGSSGVMNLLGQVTGPLLAAGATACGFPELAPLAMKAGSAIASEAKSLVANTTKSSGSSSSSSSSSASSSDASKNGEISQKDMMELQWLQEKQKEAFGLISNMLKSMSDLKMGIINNLRA